MAWENVSRLTPNQFTCGFCSRAVASDLGYFESDGKTGQIYLCPNCRLPNFFAGYKRQHPAPAFGNPVDHIDDSSVAALYEEARRSVSIQAFTSAMMCCRKVLMNVAVSKGAPQDKSFVEYVDYLVSKNYIPPDARGWVDHIRRMGNEANHEIDLKSKEDAEEVISFVEMLLKLTYEFPARIKPQS